MTLFVMMQIQLKMMLQIHRQQVIQQIMVHHLQTL